MKTPTGSESFKKLNPHLFSPALKWGSDHDRNQPRSTSGQAKRIRQSTKPLMNKLEQECWHRLCKMYDPVNVFPQSIRVKLGNGVWFKVDFMVFHPHGLEAFEVKGPHAFRGGFENLKIAATKYPSITWWLTWKDKERGTWCDQQLKP